MRSASAMPTACRNALAERAGGRLDAERVAVFGMSGGAAAELAEALAAPRSSYPRSPTGRCSAYCSIEPCPADRTKRSRSGQSGRDGSIAQEAVEQDGRRHPPCPSACRDGRNWRSARRPSPARGWRLPCRVRRRRAFVASGMVCYVHGIPRQKARRLRSISCRISGVRMSCIARSSLLPGTTMELARDMKLSWIIDSR